MNALEAYEKDVYLQPEFLNSFQGQDIIPTKKQSDIIFTGSGDSLVSSMLAESFSNTARSMDPLDLYKNKQLLDKKTVYFVSVSGNTISNIKAAKLSSHSIAITSDITSRLAKHCTDTIHLKFPSSEKFTAGSIGFLSSALCCISLVSKFRIWRPKQIFDRAVTTAKNTKISNKIYILGNLHTYPLAMYCAAKFYEILGIDAHYCRIEQFSHMELFSAKKDDTVIILEEQSTHCRNLAKHLRTVGLKVYLPEFRTNNTISKILFFIFYAQLLPLHIAKDIRQDDCHFVQAENLRHASSHMIY